MINAKAVADVLSSAPPTAGADGALVASLLKLVTGLAAPSSGNASCTTSEVSRVPENNATVPSSQVHNAFGVDSQESTPGWAGGTRPLPKELEPLAGDISTFTQRYPIDSRAYDYLICSSAAVVSHVIKEFRPPREGDSDYSGLLTAFVKRTRGTLGGVGSATSLGTQFLPSGLPPLAAPRASATSALAATPGSTFRNVPEDPSQLPPDFDIIENIQEFVQTYPIDDRAYYFLTKTPLPVQLRVLREFEPHWRSETGDYSALLKAFTRKCMDEAAASDPGFAPASWTSAAQGGGYPGSDIGGGTVRSVPLSGVPPTLQEAMATPELFEFFSKYPIDERAYDYFALSSPEVHQRVVAEFHPLREGEAAYSSLFTAFVKKCRGEVQAMGYSYGGSGYYDAEYSARGDSGIHYSSGSGVSEQPSSLKAYGSVSSAPLDESLDLQGFRAKFPMDDRAFDYLAASSREVQEWVLKFFVPHRLDDKDFSAAVTAYVRSLRAKQAAPDETYRSVPATRHQSSPHALNWRPPLRPPPGGWGPSKRIRLQ